MAKTQNYSAETKVTQLGLATEHGAPKSEAGERQVALDAQTVAVIHAHRQQQDRRSPDGGALARPELEFTGPDGTPLHPAAVTTTFEQPR